jgi:hypothetical protein
VGDGERLMRGTGTRLEEREGRKTLVPSVFDFDLDGELGAVTFRTTTGGLAGGEEGFANSR